MKMEQNRNEKMDMGRSHHSPPSNSGSVRTPRWFRRWAVEILCVFCMFLSIVAVFLTLGLHQGRPLPQWPSLITINALLALYSAVFKGAMLLIMAEVLARMKWSWYRNFRPLHDLEVFQRASEGPRGALGLIWRFRKQLSTALLPIVVATLIIVAILVEPFAQQITRYYSCSLPTFNGTRAKIPLVNIFANSDPPVHSGAALLALDAQTEGAFYSGVFGHADSPQTDPVLCATGHCNFDDYYSLGFCSKCEDISRQITVHFINGTEVIWRPKLPSGLHLNWGNGPQTLFSMHGIHEPMSSIVNLHTALNIQVLTGRPPHTKNLSLPSWSLESPWWGAAQCTLYPCVQHCTASVDSGILKEMVKEAFPLQIKPSYPRRSIPSALRSCLSERERTFIEDEGCSMSDGNPLINLGCLSNGTVIQQLNSICLFEFPNSEWRAITTFTGVDALIEVGGFFEGNITSIDDTTGVFPAAPQLQAFYNNGNVSYDRVRSKFQGIADALTKHMRRANVDSDATPVFGTTIEATTCVEVRWSWLSLPLFLLLFTSSLLLYILRGSDEAGGSLWKSSTMALLFHGLENNTRVKHSGLSSLDEMIRISKLLRVRLQFTDEGWRLIEIDRSSKISSNATSVSHSRAGSHAHTSFESEPSPLLYFTETFSRHESGQVEADDFYDELSNRFGTILLSSDSTVT